MATVGSAEVARAVTEAMAPLPPGRLDAQFDLGLELLQAADCERIRRRPIRDVVRRRRARQLRILLRHQGGVQFQECDVCVHTAREGSNLRAGSGIEVLDQHILDAFEIPRDEEREELRVLSDLDRPDQRRQPTARGAPEDLDHTLISAAACRAASARFVFEKC